MINSKKNLEQLNNLLSVIAPLSLALAVAAAGAAIYCNKDGFPEGKYRSLITNVGVLYISIDLFIKFIACLYTKLDSTVATTASHSPARAAKPWCKATNTPMVLLIVQAFASTTLFYMHAPRNVAAYFAFGAITAQTTKSMLQNIDKYSSGARDRLLKGCDADPALQVDAAEQDARDPLLKGCDADPALQVGAAEQDDVGGELPTPARQVGSINSSLQVALR